MATPRPTRGLTPNQPRRRSGERVQVSVAGDRKRPSSSVSLRVPTQPRRWLPQDRSPCGQNSHRLQPKELVRVTHGTSPKPETEVPPCADHSPGHCLLKSKHLGLVPHIAAQGWGAIGDLPRNLPSFPKSSVAFEKPLVNSRQATAKANYRPRLQLKAKPLPQH